MGTWTSVGSLRGPQGDPGTAVTGASLDGDDLVLTFSDGSDVNVGPVRGAAGAAGTSVEIRGTVADASELPTEQVDPTLATGDGFITQDDGHLHVYNDADDEWTDVGEIRGPKGDTGNAGAQGPRGTMWYVEDGPYDDGNPPTGSQPGDIYMNRLTGDYGVIS